MRATETPIRRTQFSFTYPFQHSINCGGGIGIFLIVSSTYVVVIRGVRACLWGSLYLDEFYEEDKDLR